MISIFLGAYLMAAPAPQAPQAQVKAQNDALKALALQAESALRSGGRAIVDASFVHELELAATAPRR